MKHSLLETARSLLSGGGGTDRMLTQRIGSIPLFSVGSGSLPAIAILWRTAHARIIVCIVSAIELGIYMHYIRI